MNNEIDRSEYKSDKGIAGWWSKDGAWHIALPAPNPDPVTGLQNGGFLWTAAQFSTKEDAVKAIES